MYTEDQPLFKVYSYTDDWTYTGYVNGRGVMRSASRGPSAADETCVNTYILYLFGHAQVGPEKPGHCV